MKPLLDKFRQDGYRLYRDKSFRLSFFDYFYVTIAREKISVLKDNNE